jgi:hypothetical protein
MRLRIPKQRVKVKILKILNRSILVFVVFVVGLCGSIVNARTNAEQDVRRATQKVFEDLKAGRYDDLYNSLPESSRKRVSRESFAFSLKKAEDFYKLDRLEIAAVRVSGDLAVADTTMFGHVLTPINSEGKIVAQQYLIKEGGSWKVATGDRTLVQRFLAQNPEFAKKFPIRPSRVLINRDGRWIDVSTLRQGQRER